MGEAIQIGDRVQVHLKSHTWNNEGWFDGTVVRIDPYTPHRSFYWVELDISIHSPPGRGNSIISVLNPRNIRKI